jgi:hypothetical protein
MRNNSGSSFKKLKRNIEEDQLSGRSERLLTKSLTVDLVEEGKRNRHQFIDKRSYKEAEMDIRSAVDEAEYAEQAVRAPSSPELKNILDTHQQSTIVDYSEYKDYVPELINWKGFINAIERGNTTQLAILISDSKIRLT